MDINYELYKVFYYVAISLSFSEASKKLYISQSAVSQSIKVLEKKLNQPLFIRSTKKVPADSGRRDSAPSCGTSHEPDPQRGSTDPGGKYSGWRQLRIGASDTICRYFLVPYLSRFHKEYPNIHIKVTNQTSIGCVDLLENGSVDLIFTNYPNSRLGNGKQVQHIKDFQDCFIASRKYYGELEHQPLSFKELLNYPILMLDRNSTTSEFLHALFQQHQLDLVPEIELSSNDLLLDLADIGLGIAFVPDFCLARAGGDLFQIPLKATLPTRQLALAYSDKMPISNAAKQFIQYFSQNS